MLSLAKTPAAALLALAACQTYRPEVALELYQAGDFAGAAEEIADPPWWRAHYDHDELIWLFEEGKVLRDLGRYEESSATFERALKRFEEFVLLRPDVSVTDELAGLGSQVLRDYRGSFADAILATTFLALNDLAAGDVSNARAAARQAYDWQTEAKLRFQKELERADELARSKELDREQILNAPEVKSELDAVQSFATPGYADYLNPFASFVSGVVHHAFGEAAEGQKAFEEVLGMVPDNSFVRGLVAGELEPAARTVYVLYERGLAPARLEFRVTVPTPQGWLTVGVPVLRRRPDPARCLTIRAGERELRTESLASIDGIVATQFRHDLPGIIIRTVISTLIKEVGQHAVNEATKDRSEPVRALAEISYFFLKAASSGADLRTWRTLGSEVQLAVFALPADGSFTLELEDQAGRAAASESVTLGEAPVSVVHVRSIGLDVLRVALPAGGRPRS